MKPNLNLFLILASHELAINGHFHCQIKKTLAKCIFEQIHIMHIILNQMLNTKQLETERGAD